MRQPSRSSISFAPEWSARTRIASGVARTNTSKWTKPGSAAAHAAKAEACTTKFWSPAPSRCAIASIAECGDSEVTDEFLPIIHLVFANLKTWLIGIHHGVSERHLQAYLNEFTFRFNRRFYPFNAFRSLLGIASDAKAPTYAQL